MDFDPALLPQPLKVALGDAQDIVVQELTTLICAPEGCAILTEWLVSEMGVKPWIAKLTVRAVAQGLTLGSRALGKKGLEVVASRLMGLPFIDRLTGVLAGIAGAVAGGQIRSHAHLARFLAGDGKAADLYVDPGLKVDLRLQIRQIQEIEGLKADVAQATATLLSLAERLADQHALPISWPEASDTNYLYFGSAQIPFFGRETELAELQAWLEDPVHAVGWRLIHGDGGHGKSRLALELCRRNAHLWSTGFLSREAPMADPDAWRPVEPTLIVIDYAALDPDRVRGLILALGRHAHQFEFPVRVLLLERGGEQDRWYTERFLSGSGADDATLQALRTGEPLALDHLGSEALWDLMTKVAADPARLGTSEEALAMLRGIDPESRALFAVLMARELGADSAVASCDRSSLIDNLLAHERQRIWRPYVPEMAEQTFRAHLNLLALATFIGRAPLTRIWALDHPGLPSQTDYDPGLMRRMCGRDCDQEVWPLEPDLVGERLLLKRLADNSPPRLGLRPLIPTVFNPPLVLDDWLYATQVLDRLVMDYPQDAPAVFRLPDCETLAPEAHLPLALGVMSALGRWPTEYADQGVALYEALKVFARDVPALRLEAAKGGFNLLNRVATIDLKAARALYEDLKVFAGEDPVLRLQAMEGGFNLLNTLRLADLDAACALYEDLKIFARDDPALKIEVAKGATNILGGWPSDRGVEGRALYEDLKIFVGDDPVLKLETAQAGFNLLNQVSSVDFDGACALYEDLKIFAGEDPTLRLRAMEGATNLMVEWPLDRVDQGRRLYEDLKILAGAEPALKLQAGQGGFGFSMRFKDMDLTREVLLLVSTAATDLGKAGPEYPLRAQAEDSIARLTAVFQALRRANEQVQADGPA